MNDIYMDWSEATKKIKELNINYYIVMDPKTNLFKVVERNDSDIIECYVYEASSLAEISAWVEIELENKDEE